MRFPEVLSKSDLNQMKINHLVTGCHSMITKVTKSSDGSNSVCIMVVPKKTPTSASDLRYTNYLNKLNGINQRKTDDGKCITKPDAIAAFDKAHGLTLGSDKVEERENVDIDKDASTDDDKKKSAIDDDKKKSAIDDEDDVDDDASKEIIVIDDSDDDDEEIGEYAYKLLL